MQCTYCENRCQLADGAVGRCGQYRRSGTSLLECHPDRYLLTCPIVIETMPMLHFHPGGKFLQVSTVGCNFDCPGCISTTLVREMDPDSSLLRHLTPAQVVNAALQHDCEGIAFLMNDPLACVETFLRVARAAKGRNLTVGCSTNGYFTLETLTRLLPLLDFINIGVKGLSAQAYLDCGGASPAPVLRNIERLHRAGVHVEVACMHMRDNAAELLALAQRVAAISPAIPLQVMRYIPLETAAPAWEPSIRESEGMVKELRGILRHVYLFNAPGTEQLHSRCPDCGEILLKRDFYGPMGARLLAAGNPRCGHGTAALDLRGVPRAGTFREGDFQGGYPLTRALDIVQAMLIALGVRESSQVVRVWEKVLDREQLRELHHDIQKPASYLDVLRRFGELTGRKTQAGSLIDYIVSRLALVERSLDGVTRQPRVYYAMGKPLFAIKGQRFENSLVATAGGYSVNRELDLSGRPGMTIAPEILQALNPEVIIISSFLSNRVDDVYEECLQLGLDIDAVRNRRIYTPPVPSSDFGGPRWVLGLLYLANILHPECFAFDLQLEADLFYRKFYHMPFAPDELNRSFGKPSNSWSWAQG